MIEEVLKELVAQLSRLNDNLEAKVATPAADTKVEKPKAETPVAKKVTKPSKVSKPEPPEDEDEDEDEDEEDLNYDGAPEITEDDVREAAKEAITEGKLSKADVKAKITEVGAKELSACSPEQLAEVLAFINESL